MPTRTDINKSASFASVNAALRALGFKASDLTFKKARGYTGYLTGEDVAHAEGGVIPIYSSPIEFSSVGAWVQEILSRVEQDGQFSPSDETFDRVDRAREALKRAAMGAKSNPRRRASTRRNPKMESYPCSRCGGSGKLSGYSHVWGGVCFKCGGTGTQATKPSSKPIKWAVYFPKTVERPTAIESGDYFTYVVSAKTPDQAVLKATTTFLGSRLVRHEFTERGAWAEPYEEYYARWEAEHDGGRENPRRRNPKESRGIATTRTAAENRADIDRHAAAWNKAAGRASQLRSSLRTVEAELARIDAAVDAEEEGAEDLWAYRPEVVAQRRRLAALLDDASREEKAHLAELRSYGVRIAALDER